MTVPHEIRAQLNLEPGDELEFALLNGHVTLVRIPAVVARTAGSLKSELPPLSPAEEAEIAEEAFADEAMRGG